MSDEPTPEVRALALRLFAAGRSERPGPALGRRLALIGQPTALPGPQRVEARVEGWRARLRARGALVLAAASVLAAGVAALWLDAERPPPPISISPDPIRLRAQPAESEPRATPRQVPTEPSSAAEPRAAPRRSAPRPEPRVRPPRAASPHTSAETARSAASEPLGVSPEAEPMLLLDEIELLKEARAALRSGRGQHALDLLDRHARERAGSSLEAEATLLRIETLSALGRTGDASSLATRFVRDNPNSALGDRARTFIRPAQLSR